MKISVVCVTARLGGMDVLINSLNEQAGIDKADWELVLVDDWYDERPGIAGIVGGKGVNIKHLRPKDNAFLDPCHANNLAYRHAQGELIVFFSDMLWAYPTFLADHWEVYEKYPGYTLSGFLDRYPMPALKDQIVAVNSAWSIFPEAFGAEMAARHFNGEPEYRERKGGNRGARFGDYFEMPGEYVYFNVDSLPMAVLKDLNGLDERYDGGYGLCDIDLGWRANRIGWKFIASEKHQTCKKLGMRGALVNLPRKPKAETKSVDQLRQFFEAKKHFIQCGKETISVPPGFGAWR